jgi:hypothetical protein
MSWNGHFITKQTDTMSGAWPFHDITDSHYVWGLTISWHNRQILCLGLDHFMTQSVLSWNGQAPDIVSSCLSWNGQASDIVSFCYVMKWSIPRHSVSLLCHEMVKPPISWHNRLILCLRFDHFMTKQTDTMSGAWPFHDKTEWYYVWGLTISWQHRLILCLGHSISLFCHEMVKAQT